MSDSNRSFPQRSTEVRRFAAEQALALPLRESGFWFHADLRDNFYLAAHLFADLAEGAAAEADVPRGEAWQLAVGVIGKVMELQDQNPESATYGHWPLNLGDNPAAANPNTLPVELMGCILTLFYDKYGKLLPDELRSAISLALTHVYESRLYRKPLQQMHHHEAKHTALKMLQGFQFGDKELLQEGIACANLLLDHVKTYGFKEYGALPWFWHWVQAFTCVWETVDDADAKRAAEQLLDYLWELRTEYYFKGTWIGPQSREWPHDAPRDNNTLLDYIQFGDFPAPQAIPRLEGASLYTYQVSDRLRQPAVSRTGTREMKKLILIASRGGADIHDVHSYVYAAQRYAVGGMWERREEFDNEQHRWDVTLPLTAVTEGVNQAYFFHPGNKYKDGDDRHASAYGEVLFYENAAAAVYAIPDDGADFLVGCLPLGEWTFRSNGGYGKTGDVYIAFITMQPCTALQKQDRVSVKSVGRVNGIVMEVIDAAEAEALGIDSLAQFASRMDSLQRHFSAAETEASLTAVSVSYTTIRGAKLDLRASVDTGGANGFRTVKVDRSVNGKPVSFEDYTV